MISLDHSDEAIRMVATRTGTPLDQMNNTTGVGVLDDTGKMVGAFTFSNYKGHCVDIGLAFDADRQRGLVGPAWEFIYHYVFEQLACNRMNAFIRASNEQSIRLCEGLGGVLEGIIREGYAEGEDMLVYGMLKRECNWLHPLESRNVQPVIQPKHPESEPARLQAAG